MTTQRISLEEEALQVCIEAEQPPLIFQLPPEQGRRHLDEAQNSPVYVYPASTTTLRIDTACWGSFDLHCICPDHLSGTPSVIFYIHGAGWVFGNLHTHKKLVHELAARTNSVLFFPEYSLSPEAKYPTAIEQCYESLCRLPQIMAQLGLNADLDTLTVAGDSVGGNMAAAMTMLARARGGVSIHKQLLYYPVTNACFTTGSYRQFARGYYLYRAGMMWFWDQYTTSQADRNQITASPLRATCRQLRGLPPAIILNGEADVLRDEGEAYARRLRSAGVEVTALRFQAIIHDFVMLNTLDRTKACRAAMNASTDWINQRNHP
mgnify:CR=1 FL=1